MSLSKEPAVIKKGSSVIAAHPGNEVVFEAMDNKLFNYLLGRSWNALRSGENVHRVPMRDVLDYLRLDRATKLHQSLERLCTGMIEIDYLDGNGEPRTTMAHYLSSDYSKAGNGMLVFAFDPILSDFIYDPKVYAMISLERSRDLKSAASQKLYEVMALQKNKNNPVWQVPVDELRSFLQVGDRYGRFDNFRKHVIEKAVDEVNAIADFSVLVEYVRGGHGGAVVAVTFTCRPKSHLALQAAASTKSVGDGAKRSRRKKPSSGDPDTVDILDGMTEAERGVPAEVTSMAVDEARGMVPEGWDVSALLSEWREENRGRTFRDHDAHFLAWVGMRVEAADDPLLKDIDNDVFGDLLGEGDGR